MIGWRSIMRGPALVGYPPSGLRWSGDARELYFEWRRPGDPESSTWIVAAQGGEPRKLTDDERRSAPPAFGTWDAARRRVIAVQDGDIVLVDTVARTRTVITRTAGAESAPRWARGETHVTFIRDNGVFIVPVAAADRGVIVQLSEAGPKRPDPKQRLRFAVGPTSASTHRMPLKSFAPIARRFPKANSR
jgi:hypothetical protein